MPVRKILNFVVSAAAITAAGSVLAQHRHDATLQGVPPADTRAAVSFPAPLRAETLANMRDHLLALQELQAALSASRFDQAAEIAEKRLGMSSMPRHGASAVAGHMPPGMQEMGSQMHRSASRFSAAATDAAVSNDMRSALAALAQLTATCVACHAAYRLE